MGFFGDFLWSDGSWDADHRRTPFLAIQVEDSDIAIVDFAPTAGIASGHCYLGYEPRFYYEDASANHPVAVASEATALAAWAKLATGADPGADAIEQLLASPEGDDPADDFVEVTVGKLLMLLGLGSPPDSGI